MDSAPKGVADLAAYFKVEAHNHGLTDDVIEELVERENVSTIAHLLSLAETDIAVLDIPFEQKCLLQKWMNELENWHTRLNEENLNDDFRRFLNNFATNKKKEIAEMYEQDGLLAVQKSLNAILSEYFNTPIRLALIGETGSGKSSLINAILGLKPTDKGAAAVGVCENTGETKKYSHPSLVNYTLFDVPGVNGLKINREEYTDKVKLITYDAVLICTSQRFKEIDIWLAKQCDANNIPFIFVRTKIDIDVDSEKYDHGREEAETLNTIRNFMSNKIKTEGIEAERLFLISSRLDKRNQFEFDAMIEFIAKQFGKAIREAFFLSFSAYSERIIDNKKKILEERIDIVSVLTDRKQLEEEVTLYAKQLVLSPKQIRKLVEKYADTYNEKNLHEGWLQTLGMSVSLKEFIKCVSSIFLPHKYIVLLFEHSRYEQRKQLLTNLLEDSVDLAKQTLNFKLKFEENEQKINK